MPIPPERAGFEQPEEERDSLGHGVGVELEEPEEEPGADAGIPAGIRQPFDPEKIDVITRTPTVELLLSRIRTSRIDLEPEFQRRPGIWTDKGQSRLIESLLLRIPLPTLYAAETDDEVWLIVDGIQRLTAISRFIEPSAIGASRLVLSGLEYLGEMYEGRVFEELPGRLQTRLRETELVVHLIRRGTPEEVMFNIFARINTGGLPLSAQELRHALIPGQARTFLGELAESAEFLSATDHGVRDERMADREMVLRFVAFHLNDPATYDARDLDPFLRLAMKQINGLPKRQLAALADDFQRAMLGARAIFGDRAFRKRYRRDIERRYPINKSLFEAVSVSLADFSESDVAVLVKRSTEVQRRFVVLMEDPEFDRAVSVSTGDIRKVRVRFQRVRAMFEEVLDDGRPRARELQSVLSVEVDAGPTHDAVRDQCRRQEHGVACAGRVAPSSRDLVVAGWLL